MPLVPAAGYQTEQFPQTRAPERPPEDYQNIQARPDMFGAQVGQAQERFGAIAERGATELADRAVQIQLLRNQIIADKAQSDYTQQSNKMLYGDPSDGTVGLFAKKGADAMEATQQISGQLDTLRDNMAAQLPNARARLEFNEYTRRQRMFQDRDIFSHYERETQAYGAEVQKAAVTGAIQHAGLNYNNPEQIAESDKRADQASVRQAENLGLRINDEATANMVHLARDHITQSVVDGYLAHHDPIGAENFLKTRQIYDPKIAEALNLKVHDKYIDADTKQFLFGGSGGGGKPTTTPNAIAQEAVSQGVDPKLAIATSAIESSHGANVGSLGNIFQLNASNRKEITGSTDQGSPADQVAYGINWLQKTKAELTRATGQVPDNPTVYLAHQQGVSGAMALLNNPGLPAAKALETVGVSSDIARKSISGNGGNPDAPASAFTSMWRAKYDRAENGQPSFNLDKIVQDIRERYPDPQDFAKAMTSVEGMMRMINMQGTAEKKQQDDLDQKTANGFMAIILKPGSDLSDMPAQLSQAVTDGKLKWETAQRLEAAIAKDDPTDRKYGPGFWDAYKRVTLPVGDPNRLTDVNQVLGMAGPAGPLNLAGAKELVNILESKKTPVGEGEAELQRQIFTAAHHQLSAQIPGFKDTMGETQMLKFMQVAVPMIEKLKSEGKSMGEIADLEKGPLAEVLKSLKRTPQQMTKDMMVDPTGSDLTGQPPRPAVGGTPAPSGPRIIEFDAGGNRITK